MYAKACKAIFPQISFILGPKASGKTVLGNDICQRTNMKLINFNDFIKQNGLKRKSEEFKVMELIKLLAHESSSRVLLEDFPKTEF